MVRRVTVGAVAKSARVDNVRLNQLRAKQQAAERRRRLTIAIAATAAVLLVVAVLVGVALFGLYWLLLRDDEVQPDEEHPEPASP
jgi:ABC-type Fe3+ transport system permease subunit